MCDRICVSLTQAIRLRRPLLVNYRQVMSFTPPISWLVLCCVLVVNGCAAKQAPSGCALPVGMLPKFEPVLVVDKKLALPASGGSIVIDGGNDVTVSCPGTGGFELLKGKKEVLASCRGGDVLDVNGEQLRVQDLNCQKPVRGEIRVKQGKCAKGGTFMEIGFTVKNSWHAVIEICHHNETSSTFYAAHDLFGTSLAASESKNRGGRPTFQEGGLYNTFSPDLAFKQASQLATFTKTLGSAKLAQVYTKESNLSRGHLAPNSDFVLDAYQDISFFYVNTAPQWQDVNGGNWVSLEKAVRRVAASLQTTLRVVTGTYGVLKMEDFQGNFKEMWLYNNKTTEKRLPVPEYFWKVVYNPQTQAGMAFVSLNNMWTAPSRLLCDDVCDKYGWKSGGSWKDHRKGYIYCCEVAALRQVIEYIPRMTIKAPLSVTAIASRIFVDDKK